MDALAIPIRIDDAGPTGRVSLGELRPGDCGFVAAVDCGAAGSMELVRRLMELGFVRGESVQVVAEARPGGDPFVVRIGQTALAMRREEARPVRIESSPTDPLR